MVVGVETGSNLSNLGPKRAEKRPVFVRFLVSKCMETRSDTSQALANALAKLPGTFQALRKSLFDPKRAKKRTRFHPTLTFLVKKSSQILVKFSKLGPVLASNAFPIAF